MEFFDSHAHYNDEKFEIDRDDLLKDVYKEGITRVVCAGYNVEQSEFAVNLAKEIHFMYATCGISPNDIDDFVDNNLEKIEELAKSKPTRSKPSRTGVVVKDILQNVIILGCMFHRHVLSVKPPQVYI